MLSSVWEVVDSRCNGLRRSAGSFALKDCACFRHVYQNHDARVAQRTDHAKLRTDGVIPDSLDLTLGGDPR